MKYVVIIGDGMADRPLNELGGKTPLQAAFTPEYGQACLRRNNWQGQDYP